MEPKLFFDCIGWMLGQSTVVTAAHCIYDFIDREVFAYNVSITPAYNTDDIDPIPFGICYTVNEPVLSQWFLYGDPGFDYGIYRLGCTVGKLTGNLGF